MRRVTMKTLSAGPDGVRQPGTVCDVPDDEAEILILGGYAAAVLTSAKADTEKPQAAADVETAEAKRPPETAEKPPRRRNRDA